MNKMKETNNKKRYMISLLIFLLALSPFLLSYLDYRTTRIGNEYSDVFKHRLIEVVQQQDAFSMSEITNFEWDKMYVFEPYTSRSEMERIVGGKWTTAHSYYGYLLARTFIGEHELDNDTFHKLVFVNGDRVVLDITYERSVVDFTKVMGMVERDQSNFAVNRTGDRHVPIVITEATD